MCAIHKEVDGVQSEVLNGSPLNGIFEAPIGSHWCSVKTKVALYLYRYKLQPIYLTKFRVFTSYKNSY